MALERIVTAYVFFVTSSFNFGEGRIVRDFGPSMIKPRCKRESIVDHAFPIFSTRVSRYTVEVGKVKSGPVANSSIYHGENLESRGF